MDNDQVQPTTTSTPQPSQAQVVNQTAQAPVAQPTLVDSTGAPMSANGVPGSVPGSVPARASAPTPAQAHTSWFHGMMARMNQGDQVPVRDRNGNPVVDPQTGQAKMQPLTSKQMGRSILAGVLSAMAATEQHQPYRNGNGIWVNPSNEAVSAGEQAFRASGAKPQQIAANEELTKQRSQQYAVYKANVDQYKMAHEIWQMKKADKEAAVAPFAAGFEAAENGDIDGYDPATGDLSEQEAHDKLMSGGFDSTTHMMVPNGKTIDVLDANGNPTGDSEIRYMILPGQNGKIPLTQKMIDAHKDVLGSVAPGTQIPLTQWTNIARKSASKDIVTSMISDLTGTLNDGKPLPFDFSAFVKKANLTQDQMDKFRSLSATRTDPVAFQKGLEALDQETHGNLSNALAAQGIKIDSKKWADERAADLAAEKKGVGAEQAAPERVAALPDLAKGVGLTPEQSQLALSELPKTGATNDEVTKATENIGAKRRRISEQATNECTAGMALDKSYQFNSTQLEKVGKPIDDAVSRFGRLQDTINQTTPQADALVAPELLTVMAGGAGSGLRMNEAEISRIVGGRSNYESLKAAANKWQSDPTKALSITASQRQQIKALMTVVYSKLQGSRPYSMMLVRRLISGTTQTAHRQTVADAKTKIDGIDARTQVNQPPKPDDVVKTGSFKRARLVYQLNKVRRIYAVRKCSQASTIMTTKYSGISSPGDNQAALSVLKSESQLQPQPAIPTPLVNGTQEEAARFVQGLPGRQLQLRRKQQLATAPEQTARGRQSVGCHRH